MVGHIRLRRDRRMHRGGEIWLQATCHFTQGHRPAIPCQQSAYNQCPPPFLHALLQIATLPIDTAKVRLQLLQKLRGQGAPAGPAATAGVASASGVRLGMVSVMQLIAREEGAAALYKGIWPAIHRQLVFASLRIGLYKHVRGCSPNPYVQCYHGLSCWLALLQETNHTI
jgi:hypothetical protein